MSHARPSRTGAAAALTLAALAALTLLAWAVRPGTAPTPTAPPQRVLVLGEPDWPGVALLGDFLRGAQVGGRSLASVQLDRVGYRDEIQLREDIRRLRPDIGRYDAIYAPSLTLARVAQLEVERLPIVFDGVDDPVALCLVDSLARPGRNATGYMHLLDQSELRMMQVLRDAFPGLRRVLVPVSADNDLVAGCQPDSPAWQAPRAPCRPGEHGADAVVDGLVDAARLQAYGQQLGLEVRFVLMCSAQDFALLPALATRHGSTGVMVPWHALFADLPARLVGVVNTARLPAVYPTHRFTEQGGLMSLEPVGERGLGRESYRQLARVLAGDAPAEMPVASPRGFSLVVNARAASAAGLRPSLTVLRRADTVLQ